jgi:hypothetical protein
MGSTPVDATSPFAAATAARGDYVFSINDDIVVAAK